MNVRKIIICVTLVLMTVSAELFAQPGDPGDDPDNPSPVPLSGLGYLLVAGALLGVKKLRDLSRRNK